MAYGKVVNSVLIQKQPNPEKGFIAIPDAVVVGFTFDGRTFSAPLPSSDQLWADLRAERDRRLVESDPFLAPDRDVDQNAWIAYRQVLRDLPETVTDPAAVTWPERPPSDGAVT